MATGRTKRELVVKLYQTEPVDTQEIVRKSCRRILAPESLEYFPEESTTKPKKKKVTSTHGHEEDKHSGNTRDDNKGLSAYELERLESIRQNQAFLASINLYQTSAELKELTRPKPSQRGLLRKTVAVAEVLPPRKSQRLLKNQAMVLPLPTESKKRVFSQSFSPTKMPPGPQLMKALNMEAGDELPSDLIQLFSEDSREEREMMAHQNKYRSTLETMRLTEDSVAKVVKDRIYSAAFHPCSSSLLVAAGDYRGNVGLWKLGGEWGDDGVLLFQPHTRPVCCMTFSPTHPTQLLSLSYDGSLRCMDVEKGVFDDVYDCEDVPKSFDFMSHDSLTMVVGSYSGDVAIVDRRTPGNSHESVHYLDPKALRCVSVHPLQRHYLAVAENRVVSIYDSRRLKKIKSQPVSQLHGHSLSISSAYFSPWTGNRVVTSCMDNNIRVYDTAAMTSTSPLLTTIRHNMQTGRFLSKLSAVWDPKQEDCFSVGMISKPRRIQVYDQSGKLQHSFMDSENLSTVPSITAFHPTRNALLAGNASGRIHVFSD